MVRPIRRNEIAPLAEESGFSVDGEEISEFAEILDHMLNVLNRVEANLPRFRTKSNGIAATRDPGRLASRTEDPLNAVIRWCRVKSDKQGTLTGLRIGLKDNIAVAGIPMTAGSDVLTDYIPKDDATVVSRILESGGEISAILNLEGFAWSAGGETSSFGPVLNPFDHSRTASGSSGGSAAALFYEGIDVTLGTDQGGSVRLPASWCGVLGLKPSRGCIPYTGVLSIEHTCDYIGPMSRTAKDMALTLEAIAGPDSWDSRQAGIGPTEGFYDAVESAPDDLEGVVIGVLREGFSFENQPSPREGTIETATAVRDSLTKFEDLGARIVDVTVPIHDFAGDLLFPTMAEAQNSILQSFGNSQQVAARYAPDLAIAVGKGLESRANSLPPTIKFVAILGNYLRKHHFGWHYAVAKNFMPLISNAYDEVLERCDFLLMPTAGHYAHPVKPDASISERVLRGISMVTNTGQFNMSGHPALTIPVAEANRLPVGVMLVGPKLSDARLLAVARTYEKAHGWLPVWSPNLLDLSRES